MRIGIELIQLYDDHHNLNHDKLVRDNYYYYYSYYYHHILLDEFIIFCCGRVLPGFIVHLVCSIFVVCSPSSLQCCVVLGRHGPHILFPRWPTQLLHFPL